MAQGLSGKDAPEVALVLELLEDGGRRAPHGVTEIHRVAEVHRQAQGVDDDIHAAADGVPEARLLQVQREEHHHHPQGVGVEDGSRIENETALQQFKTVPPRQIAGKSIPILCQKSHSRHKIDDIGYGKIDEYCDERK